MTRFIRRSLQALREDSYQHAARKLRRLAELIEAKCETPGDIERRDRAVKDLEQFSHRLARKHETRGKNENQI